MSYSFSISGHLDSEDTENTLIEALAKILQEMGGTDTSGWGSTQYHGTVDLYRVQTGTAVNTDQPPLETTLSQPDVIEQAATIPLPEEVPMTEGLNQAGEVVSTNAENSEQVAPVEDTGEPEPEYNERGEVIGFKVVPNSPTPEVDKEGEVVGFTEGKD